MDYNKLRGRGPDATERITGADGIFRFSINAVERNFTKSALFQSKTGTGGLQRLLAQSILLSTWKEAAFVIRYSRDGYTAFGIDEAMKQALRLPHPPEMPLADWLMGVFIACKVGDTDLHYEHSDRVLCWKDLDDRLVHTSFQVRHAFHLHVTGPKWQESRRGEPVSTTDVHMHRMRATDEELLGVPEAATAVEVKRAKKEAAKLYHVDKHQQLESGIQHVLELRMKEYNLAAERILVKLKK